ncbi:hypothetical protein TNCV_4034751 [Trichonephila clavipes]|nr:hypothetical protein TNCV_4034751 [Trichonephila clavipes]
MNTDKTIVAKGFGGKNFPILNKGNQVARCEGEIGVPNCGPRAVKGWSQSWNIAKSQIVGDHQAMPSEVPVDRWDGVGGLQIEGQEYPTHALWDSSQVSMLANPYG